MQLSSSATKLSCVVLGSSSLAAFIIGLGATSASAQITIQTTGALSGSIQLPNNNPNFNNRVTRVDTDSSGTYQRNIGSKNNPNNVTVYQSNYVKVGTRADGSLHYFVDFKGIPVISFDGTLNSPILSDGTLTPYTYQGQVPGTKFQGVVQDEFGLTKAFYTGIVTDPNTGKQYQGTFQVSGQGPRYSDRNGGLSPTVFDFKSDLPGKPTVTSWKMNNVPLVRLTIVVPENATPIIPSSGNNTPTPAPTPTPTPVVSGNNTPTPTPVVSVNNTQIPAPVLSGNSTPTSTPVVSGNTPTSTPVVDGGSAIAQVVPQALTSPISTVETTTSNFSSPVTAHNIEFSSGNSFAANLVGLENSTDTSNSCSVNSVNCRNRLNTSKQAIGPRSRVFVR